MCFKTQCYIVNRLKVKFLGVEEMKSINLAKVLGLSIKTVPICEGFCACLCKFIL